MYKCYRSWEAALPRDEDYKQMSKLSLSQSVIDNDRINEDQENVHNTLEIVPAVNIIYCIVINVYS